MYIQCKDRSEVEKVMESKGIKFAFVTEDHRIYDTVDLADDDSYTGLYPEKIHALDDLRSAIEHLEDGHWEQAFDDLVSSAKMCQDAFIRVRDLVGSKPASVEDAPQPKLGGTKEKFEAIMRKAGIAKYAYSYDAEEGCMILDVNSPISEPDRKEIEALITPNGLKVVLHVQEWEPGK